jgi:teichuronic acid biosynthesis glycosyltransferase TuaC
VLRVLTLSSLFPNAAQPVLGVFVERQTAALVALDDVEVQVVAPVGLPPWPLSLHPHYRPRQSLARAESWQGLTVHRPCFRVWPRIGEAGAARAMARALLPMLKDLRRSFRFDVIDAQYFWPDGPAAMILARELGLPFSIKARGSDISYWPSRPGIGEQLVAAANAASGLLAVSSALRDDMIALGMPGDRIRVHYTGVDLDRFRSVDRAAAKRRLGIEGPLLVSAGALIPRKGQAITIEALRRIPGATLLLIGDGPDRPALERLAERHGVQDRARFLGSQPHEALPELLGAADVSVLPTASEGLANVWVESLACGTPVVTTAVGGAREAIDRPEAGRLVARAPGAVAAAVNELLNTPTAAGQVRQAAERFSWQRNAAELRDHLIGALR